MKIPEFKDEREEVEKKPNGLTLMKKRYSRHFRRRMQRAG